MKRKLIENIEWRKDMDFSSPFWESRCSHILGSYISEIRRPDSYGREKTLKELFPLSIQKVLRPIVQKLWEKVSSSKRFYSLTKEEKKVVNKLLKTIR